MRRERSGEGEERGEREKGKEGDAGRGTNKLQERLARLQRAIS
jgi:hypothetical protein